MHLQSEVNLLDELLLVALESFTSGSSDDLGSPDSLLLEGRETSGKDGLADKGNGHTHVQSVDSGPLSGTLLASGIENLLHNWGSILVLLAEDVTGDLDQEGVKDTVVPLAISAAL